ncbi:hypothetical protein DH09_05380 [Bacillaceae bacterium JMAK1]|nr:hypothetical protein DH09_05380 [Bacillaceae bacterium JMAK1]
MNWANRFPLTSDDVNLHVYPSTSPEHVNRHFVLIHGFMSWSYSFKRLIPYLSAYGNIMTLDLPGFGLSNRHVRYHYSYEQYTKTVHDLIRANSEDDDEVIAIGHSMGGQIALRLVQWMPEVSKAVLLSSSGNLAKSSLKLRAASSLPFFHHYLSKYVRERDVHHVLQQVISDKRSITDEQIQEYGRPLENDAMYRSLAKFIRQREGDLSRDTLHTIKKPILLLWGENDRIVPVSVGRYLDKELPNSKLHVYPNVGHLLPEEIPEKTSQAIAKFLA